MKKRSLYILTLLLFLLTISIGTASASPLLDTTVKKGETINNDVVVLDGDLEIEEDAVVNGDVTVFNGDARIDGTVNGDVVLFNGNLDAAETAVIHGDCVLLNGRLDNETESSLNCTNIENLPNFIPALPSIQGVLRGLPEGEVRVNDSGIGFFGRLAAAAGRSLLMGLLAFVLASFAPQHLTQVDSAVRRKPVASGVVGVLTAVAVPSLVALLLPVSLLLSLICIGLLGFPIMLALIVGLAAAAILGWITIGNVVGQRLADPLKLKVRTLPTTAALGTAVLTFGIGLLGLIPFVFGEGLLTFLIICIGIGGAALTKFGTRAYPMALTEATVDNEKVTAVLETLAVEDTADLKE